MIKRKPLLSTNNHKTMLGEGLGYKTYILYMSPFTHNSKGINVCSHASKGCAESCLVSSGFGGIYQGVKQGRINKTEYFLSSRVEFINQLKTEIEKYIRLNEGKAIVCIRLNGTSDLRYESYRIFNGLNIFELFPNLQFYDYTKNHYRFNNPLPSNYHLTFSRSETNNDKAIELLNRGFNVAMVFNKVPIRYKGFEVINGDKTDLRFKDPKGVIVGLKYKQLTGIGSNNKLGVESGFVIDTISIQNTIDRLRLVMNRVKNKLLLSV